MWSNRVYIGEQNNLDPFNQSIPLFRCQTNLAVEEPLNGDTIIKLRSWTVCCAKQHVLERAKKHSLISHFEVDSVEKT